jgi:hypothetical protein
MKIVKEKITVVDMRTLEINATRNSSRGTVTTGITKAAIIVVEMLVIIGIITNSIRSALTDKSAFV